MIHLRYNEESRWLSPEDFENVGEVVDECLGAQRTEHLIAVLRVDGFELDQDEFDEARKLGLEGVSRIELDSRCCRAVGLDALESSAEYAGAVSRALAGVAEHFRDGAIEEANRLYVDALDGLDVLLHAIDLAARVLDVAETPLLGLARELQPWFAQLTEAHAREDWVTVADLLQFELGTRMAAWPGLIEEVRASARGVAEGAH